MDDSRTIVPKIVFFLITWERVFFFFIKYGTKWSFSVKVEPIIPSSELQAEQIGPQCMIRELLFLKMCSFLSNGNQLFRVPNTERNRLDLNG